jgi:hypothetical protein
MSTERQPDAILLRHFYWGWVVYDSDLGESFEAIFTTEADAQVYRSENFSGDAAQDRYVSVFPLILFRGKAHEGRGGHRLTREEIAILGPCPHLDDALRVGEGAWLPGA